MCIRYTAILSLTVALSGCGDSSPRATTTAPGSTSSPAGAAASDTPDGASAVEMAATLTKAMALPKPKPIDIEPCTLVTAEDAAPFFSDHEPAREKGGSDHHPFRECYRTGGTMGLSSALVAVAGGLDINQFDTLMEGQAELSDQQDKMRAIDGVGDRAYWLSNFLWVQTGSTTFYVSVSTIPALDEAAALTASRQLAEKVLTRL